MRNKTSNFRIPHSDALPLSHIDFTVSKAYYQVHIVLRVLYTVRINNVNSVMFVNRQRKMVTFELSKEMDKDVFHLVTRVEQRKMILAVCPTTVHGGFDCGFG